MKEQKFPDRILYVEDNLNNVSMVRRVCMTKQIAMEHASNYAKGRIIIEGADSKKPLNSYGLLLLDYNLGDGIGSDLALKARELGYQGPIVMYSGDDQDLDFARKATAHLPNMRSLEKPASLQDLLAALSLE